MKSNISETKAAKMEEDVIVLSPNVGGRQEISKTGKRKLRRLQLTCIKN